MEKRTVVFIFKTNFLNLWESNPEEYIGYLTACCFLLNKKNISDAEYKTYFAPRGEPIFSACYVKLSGGKIEDLITEKNNEDESDDGRIRAFLTNYLEADNYEIRIRLQDNTTITSRHLCNSVRGFLKNPSNFRFYKQIQMILEMLVQKGYFIRTEKIIVDVSEQTNELDLIYCILFLEKCKETDSQDFRISFAPSGRGALQRVQIYLSHIFSHYNISIESEDENERKGLKAPSEISFYGRLSPLYVFSKNRFSADIPAYSVFAMPINRKIISEKTFSFLCNKFAARLLQMKINKKQKEQEKKKKEDEKDPDKKSPSIDYYISSIIKEGIQKSQIQEAYDKTASEQIWRCYLKILQTREKKAENLMKGLGYEELVNDAENLIKKMYDTLWNNPVIQSINQFIRESKKQDAPAFSYVLLLQYIGTFLDEDPTFGIPESENVQGACDETVNCLQCVFFSIVAYTEGIFQVMENACLHSSSQRCFLSVKFHATSTRVGNVKQLIKNAATIQKLLDKYPSAQTKYLQKISSFDYHLEIRVNDCSDYGIVQTYQQSYPLSESLSDLTLKNFFDDYNKIIDFFQTEKEAYKDWLIYHYGLRVLKRIVHVNQGALSVSSVHNNECDVFYYCNSKEQKNSNIAKQFYGTEYCILLPISVQNYQTNFISTGKDSQNKSLHIDAKVTINSVISIQKLESILSPIPTNQTKKEAVESIVSYIQEELKKSFKQTSSDRSGGVKGFDLSKSILCLDLSLLSCPQIELVAKAILSFIAEHKTDSKNRGNFYFALYFGRNCDIKIYEFIRMISVFYLKQGKNKWMRNVQIAICSDKHFKHQDRILPVINMVLAGENISSAAHTAIAYAYYNSEFALQYIATIQYLTRMDSAVNGKEVSIQSLVPFELFLSQSANNPKLADHSGDSWFSDYIRQVLETPIQDVEYGCKHEDIHVRIGSKIHIHDFYEAELLFHNIANLERFAFVLCRDIAYRISQNKNRNLILIGYENYSEQLILKTQEYLKEYLSNIHVAYSIFYKKIEENGYTDFLTNQDGLIKEIKKTPQIVSVIPVGTTLSTVYKIQNVLRRTLNNSNLNIESNYAIIEVRDNSSDSQSALEELFWKSVDSEKGSTDLHRKESFQPSTDTPKPYIINDYIILNQEDNSDHLETKVHCFITLRTTWENAYNCKWCRGIIARDVPHRVESYLNAKLLIDVDRTSTVPNSIFRIKAPNKSGYTALIHNPLENDRRIEDLQTYVKYAHICLNHNHFQFYFKTKDYFLHLLKDSPSKRSGLFKWLRGVRDNLFDRIFNAFNIIVSPLKMSNSGFINVVEKEVFDHNIRFLHFSLEDSYREEIRTKFSYIAQEYRRIKTINPYATVNVFFVDDTITTGRTFQRARSFIRTLLIDSGLFNNSKKVFDGIITLINRGSYDTICNYVSHPEEDFFAYVHVAISAIKASGGTCPICQTAEHFAQLKKRSSEYDIRREFARLEAKNQKRTQKEYDEWLDHEIETRPAYFLWLKKWLLIYDTDNEFKDVKAFIRNLYKILVKDPITQPQNSDDPVSTEEREDLWRNLSIQNIRSLFDLEMEADDLRLFRSIFIKKGEINLLSSLSLNNLQENPSDKLPSEPLSGLQKQGRIILNRCKKTLVQKINMERDGLRMVCSHRCNIQTENILKEMNDSDNRETITDKTVALFLELLDRECGYHQNVETISDYDLLCSREEDEDYKKNAQKIDKIASYIKISSRPLPARYHHVEQAMLKLITGFALCMLHDRNNNLPSAVEIAQKVFPDTFQEAELCKKRFLNIVKVFEDYTEKSGALQPHNVVISPVHQFDLFRILMNRLAVMRSFFSVNQDVLRFIFNDDGLWACVNRFYAQFIDRLKEEEKADYQCFCQLPSQKDTIFEFKKMIMRFYMGTDDDSAHLADLNKEASDE